jgi:hypothetical protein
MLLKSRRTYDLNPHAHALTLPPPRCALLGLATGDALGTTLEFKPPGTFACIADMVGGVMGYRNIRVLALRWPTRGCATSACNARDTSANPEASRGRSIADLVEKVVPRLAALLPMRRVVQFEHGYDGEALRIAENEVELLLVDPVPVGLPFLSVGCVEQRACSAI